MNKKSKEERTKILACLVEGNSIRGTSRITGASKGTVLKLLVDTGKVCEQYQKDVLVNLTCHTMEIDEMWSFVHTKRLRAESIDHGDIWTWIAMCSDTKLVPCWRVDKRTAEVAVEILTDLKGRLLNRIQLTTDGNSMYVDAVEAAFGHEIDYAMLVKVYETNKAQYNICTGVKKIRIEGSPVYDKVSTSFVERQNLTLRTNIKRMTRRTNAFSKKVENHRYATALHFMYYNFVRIHRTLQVTPVMAAGVDTRPWELGDIIDMANVFS